MGLGAILSGDVATPGFLPYLGRELNSYPLPKYITTKKGFSAVAENP
jgi:hypothetical protein